MAAPQPASPYDDQPLEEVHLAAAPLIRVLAQVRHPALRVLSRKEEGDEAAMKVAARMAKQYPIFESEHESSVLVTPEGVTERKSESSWIWRLRSPDEMWQVSFTRNFIALETSNYLGRTDFLKKLSYILSAYLEEINPPSASRIGIRYTNRISKPGQIDRISQLVRAELLGPVGAQLSEGVELSHSFGQAQYLTSSGGSLLNWGLLPPNGVFDPTIAPTASSSWILDIDVFSGQRESFDAASLSSLANDLAARAYTHFRWAVAEEFLRTFKEA